MKKIKVERKGRVCRYPNCSIVLSIYNHDLYCNIHLNKMCSLGLKPVAAKVDKD